MTADSMRHSRDDRRGDLSSPEAQLECVARIRFFEETVMRLFAEGRLHGTTHTCMGQEAIAVAVAAALEPEDVVFCPHRSHGHFIAYGGRIDSLFAELMGRSDGVCGGRGGSQHLHFDGFFSNGVQGGIVGNAVGAALARQLQGGNGIVVVFLGDGTLGEGLVYESLNFAALRRLPILFVLENNRYAQTTPIETAVSGSVKGRAETFAIPAFEIESNDVADLVPVFRERIAYVRNRRAPVFQVVHTYRLGPHSKGDDFRDPAEIASWREKDPLLLAARHVSKGAADKILNAARDRISRCLASASESRPAHFEPAKADTPALMPVPWVTEDITYVKALNRALQGLLESDPSTFLLGEDLLDPGGGAFAVTKGLSTRFPERVFSTPISEAGLVAWGTGAALMGMRPIVEIMFGDFLALAADQILNHAAKYRWISGNQLEVGLVIRTPMGGGRGYGPSHSQSIERMFCGIPGLMVVAPPPLLDAGEILRRASALTRDPVLFIEHKNLYPKLLLRVEAGRTGMFQVRSTESVYPTLHLRLVDEPAEAVIVTYGGNVPMAMEAAQQLMRDHELAVDIVVPTRLSPLPADELSQFVCHSRVLVTLEESPCAFGWGAEVVAALAESTSSVQRRFVRVGAAASPIPAARSLESEILPRVDKLVDAVLRNCS